MFVLAAATITAELWWPLIIYFQKAYIDDVEL